MVNTIITEIRSYEIKEYFEDYDIMKSSNNTNIRINCSNLFITICIHLERFVLVGFNSTEETKRDAVFETFSTLTSDGFIITDISDVDSFVDEFKDLYNVKLKEMIKRKYNGSNNNRQILGGKISKQNMSFQK